MKRWEKPVIQELKFSNTKQYDIETYDMFDGLCYCNQTPGKWKSPILGIYIYKCGHKYRRLNDGGKCPNNERVFEPSVWDILPKCS